MRNAVERRGDPEGQPRMRLKSQQHPGDRRLDAITVGRGFHLHAIQLPVTKPLPAFVGDGKPKLHVVGPVPLQCRIRRVDKKLHTILLVDQRRWHLAAHIRIRDLGTKQEVREIPGKGKAHKHKTVAVKDTFARGGVEQLPIPGRLGRRQTHGPRASRRVKTLLRSCEDAVGESFYCRNTPKTRTSHGIAHFGIAHEMLPNQPAAIVLRHHQRNAGIDGQHICSNPSGLRIESIGEPVLTPDAVAEAHLHGLQRVETFARGKRNRTARRTGNQRAIQGIGQRRARGTAPGLVSIAGLRSRESPQVGGKAGKLQLHARAHFALCQRGKY